MQIFNARKVFLCLRPEIYALKNEHVTVEYIGHEPDWNELQETAKQWLHIFGGFPVTVAVNGYANWQAKDDYHLVALVEFKDMPALSFSKNWHITLESSRQPLEPIQFDRDKDAFRYDVCRTLWVGYTNEAGEKKFIEFHNAHHLVKSVANAVPV